MVSELFLVIVMIFIVLISTFLVSFVFAL